MAKTRNQRGRIIIESDLSEKQVELDVSAYLGGFGFLNSRLRLLDSEESITGADTEIAWRGRLLYFQFKAPTGLTPLREKPKPGPKQTTGIIRKYRFENDLQQEPYSIYFQLRKLAATATVLQHNLLHNYDQGVNSRAFYVVPTILNSQEYSDLFRHSLPCLPSFFVPSLEMFDPEWRRTRSSVWNFASKLALNPFFRTHALIRPHTSVTTHKHHYSFSIHGGDVAFHSPEVIGREVMRLSDFLKQEIQDTYHNFERCPTIAGLALEAFETSRGWISENDNLGKPTEHNSLKWLQDHGRRLLKDFEIKQFILLMKQ